MGQKGSFRWEHIAAACSEASWAAGFCGKGDAQNGNGSQRREYGTHQTCVVGYEHDEEGGKQATGKQEDHQKSLPKIQSWMGEERLRKPFR